MKRFLVGLAWVLGPGLLLAPPAHPKGLPGAAAQRQAAAIPAWRAADPDAPIGPRQICRAATALSKARRLGEIKIDEGSGKGKS